MSTIFAAGSITFKTLEARWVNASINEKKESRLPRSSFSKIREEIQELYGVEIKCDKRNDNKYYIDNLEDLRQRAKKQMWLFDFVLRQSPFDQTNLPMQPVSLMVIPSIIPELEENPLHPSQRICAYTEDDDYVRVEYLLKPTLRFYRDIRSYGTDVELVEPLWIREHLRKDAMLLYDTYVTGDESALGQRLDTNTFIHPIYCNIMNRPENTLYLNIKQEYFDQIMAGTKTQEFREVKPTTIKKLLQLDANGFEIEDEEGNSQPIHYNAIHFRVGMNKVADEAIVEVKGEHVEVLEFLVNEDGQYLTDDNGGLILYDEEFEAKFGEKNEDGTPKLDELGEPILLPHAPFEYITDEKGKTIFDENGIPVAPEFDEEGCCTNGLLWTVQQVVFDLGQILDKNIVEK